MSGEQKAIVCENLTKRYEIYDSEFDRLKGLLSGKRSAREFMALDHVSCSFNRGEIVGFVGLNGSGKSTMARILAGISTPTSGKLEINGSVSMLSTGSGMENLLTGRENIVYKCLLLGFTYKQIKDMEQQIIDFADIGFYIDQPIRTYSSGMRSRLGFAISAHLDPAILIVDEALSVGDSSFTQKCMDRMMEFRDRQKTIIFVSHSTQQVKGFCHRVMWLHKGHCVGFDDAERMVGPYELFAKDFNGMSVQNRANFMPTLVAYQEKYFAAQKRAGLGEN